MFWSDPHFYGLSFPYREFTTPQVPFATPPVTSFQNYPRFVPPMYGLPQAQFGLPQAQFVPPMYGLPQAQFGLPQSQFVPPMYGLPQAQFGWPPAQFGMSQGQSNLPMTSFFPYVPPTAINPIFQTAAWNPNLLPHNVNVPSYSPFRAFGW